ncbi:MAG: hypothetical protein ACOY4K_09450 [Pseudomonadota bacterium]
MTAGRLFLAVLATATMGAASAPPSTLEPAFANTIVTTYPSGRTTRLWLNRNGTYDAQRANGQRTAGVWELKGDRLCLTQKKPIYVPVAYCTGVVPGRIGASWKARSIKGEPVVNTIVAGRVGFSPP